jgi:hypothetical protein
LSSTVFRQPGDSECNRYSERVEAQRDDDGDHLERFSHAASLWAFPPSSQR